MKLLAGEVSISPESSVERPGIPFKRKLVFSLCTTLISLFLFEVGFRLFHEFTPFEAMRFNRFRRMIWKEESPFFQGHPFLSYVRHQKRGSTNTHGFLDRKWNVERKEGATRIVCLGASTTEGETNLNLDSSYPSFLQGILREEFDPATDVMNWGMAGWTTAETMINFFLNVQDYEPDVVILHHSVNDVNPRMWPDYRSDFSHYRTPWRELKFSLLHRTLTRASALYSFIHFRRNRFTDVRYQSNKTLPETGFVTVEPDTTFGFRRNLRSISDFVRLRGGIPVLTTMPFSKERADHHKVYKNGILEHNQIIRELCKTEGYFLIDLANLFEEGGEELSQHFKDMVHLEAPGNRIKARIIAEELRNHVLSKD